MTKNDLQPWARFLFNCKLNWLLILIVYLLLPVYIAVGYFKQISPSKSVQMWSSDITTLEQIK
jgi:hypothetical protein